ncbi:MAG: hypothetical protein KC572_06635 [Gammaproteobacteria bacterium]|nr:hypothetical protein [Gammaproteobacteria bacterium]
MKMIGNLSKAVGALMSAILPVCVQASPYPDVAPLFAADTVLEVTIEAPMGALMDIRPDKAYLDGSFTFTTADGTERKLGLKLRTRGNYRRAKEHCDFAPIRLNFSKSQVKGTLFAGQDKLKLVTHCQNNDRDYEQLVLREYLAYRMLHELTPKSFAVRLMRITYINTENKQSRTKLGFVIEDGDAVAKRNGMKLANVGLVTREYLDLEQENLIHVFEYMIGNTEYSVMRAEPNKECCHNIDLMAPKGVSLYTPLAYDFDFAGFVNAPYAEPNPRYKLPTVRVRLFKGRCEYDEQLQSTIRYFQEKKDRLYQIIDAPDILTSISANHVRKYIDTFYERIAEPADVEKWLIEKCYEP